MEQDSPELIEEYVPGAANGHNYMVKLCHFPDGPWSIELVHVEGKPPLSGSDRVWPTRSEALQAAGTLVAGLAA